jgi:hypothetical protein
MSSAIQKVDEAIPPFEPLDAFCKRWGWSRSFAYILAGQKKIELKKVEGKTYGDNRVALDYLATCPIAEISPPASLLRRAGGAS